MTEHTSVPVALHGPEATIVELATDGSPGMKVTVPFGFTIGEVIDKVLISALVDFSVQVETPNELVAEHVEIVFPVPDALNTGISPVTGRFKLSLSVMVIVDVNIPSAFTGPVPVIVEFATTAEPVLNSTVPPDTEMGVRRESVFIWAVVEAMVQVEEPLVLDDEQIP